MDPATSTRPALPRVDPAPLDDFLLSGPTTPVALVDGLARGLVAEGLPLERLWLGGLSLHPLVAARGALWTPGDGVAPLTLPIGQRDTLRPEQVVAPVAGRIVVVRLAESPRGTWGLSRSLWDEGFVEVALMAWQDGDHPLALMSFATRSAFSEAHVARLAALRPSIGLVLRLIDRTDLVSVLAATYLGRHAGERVVRGQIHRGDGEHIRAAIWFSDLRGFSDISERLPMPEVLRFLDDAFEVQVGCIERAGGEVLKFIGDGLLAVFRAGDDRAACAAALEAAIALGPALAEVNARRASDGRTPIRRGLALHYGEVLYGNIGASGRLDFTVVGPAVNLAARLEGLCGRLDRELLLSQDFVDRCPGRAGLLGRFPLKGVGEVAAFALPDPA